MDYSGIKPQMKAQKLKVNDVVRLSKVSRKTVSGIINGKIQPSVQTLELILNACNLELRMCLK